MMNDAEIRRYAGLMAELGLTGLEVTEKDQVIRLERSPAPAAARETVAVPAEDAEPFVKVGDKVKRGQTLCIVEAMKLMNEIMAEVDGEIVEICVANGQVVDYGSPLFRIRER